MALSSTITTLPLRAGILEGATMDNLTWPEVTDPTSGIRAR